MSKPRRFSKFKKKKPFQPKGTPIEYALRSLTMKRQTEKQIREKLEKYYPEIDHVEVIDRLKELDYLNDDEFCAAWIRHRTLSSPRGHFVLRRELQMKGVPSHMIEAHLSEASFDDELKELAQKKWTIISRKEDDKYKQKQKLQRFLLSRGFSVTDVLEVVKQIASHTEEC